MPSTQDVLNTLPKQERTLQQLHAPERLDPIPDTLAPDDEMESAEPLHVELRTDHIAAIPNDDITAPTPHQIPANPTPSVRSAKDPLTRDIERILEENLADSFASMSPEQQQKFASEGERVTATLRQIIKSGVIHMKKILSLISGWLRMIPGVNRYFLEKESKIKAEKILILGGQF